MQDVIVVGAGPGGLTAACYLGRFRRPTLVLDAGESRARWIPTSHNTPGFPDGVGGVELLRRSREQAQRYGAEIRSATVLSIARIDGGFSLDLATGVEKCRYLILATGVRDRLPPLYNVEDAINRTVLRICPVCDAYEAIGKRVAVIGTGAHALREAEFLRTYSDDVTVISHEPVGDAKLVGELNHAGIRLVYAGLADLSLGSDQLTVRDRDGHAHHYEVAYSALGCEPRNDLAAHVGARIDDRGALVVNAHQQTSVDGLYAAGDVVRGLNQIVVAGAEAAVAATDIHNRLRGRHASVKVPLRKTVSYS